MDAARDEEASAEETRDEEAGATGRRLAGAAAVESVVEGAEGGESHAGSAGLGAAVGRGVAWSVAATVVGKGLSFAAQIVLGWWLSKGDFGVYAIAMSAANVGFAFRDGGLWNVLISRGAREFEKIAGPIYWMGLWLSAAAAGMMALAAPGVAWAYGDARLAWLIWIIAVSWPLSAPCWVMRARLIVDLRFKEFTRCVMMGAVVRYGTMIGCAMAGCGAMSFVLPLLATAVADNATAYWMTGERPWRRAARREMWCGLLGQSVWCIVGTLANTALEMGIYLVMGVLASAGEVGVYYFAYQLVAQTGAMLAANVQGVLLPALSRVGEGSRRREAALRSVRALMLLSAPASVGLAVVFAPVEALVWRGKWAEAYWAVLALAAAYPMRAVFVVPQTLELARGGFKRSALMTLWTGVGLMVVGGVAAWVRPEATAVSVVSGAYLVVVCLGWCVWEVGRTGAGVWATVGAAGPAWVVALGAGAVGVWVEWRMRVGGVGAVARGAAAMGVFGVVFVVGARLVLAAAVRDVLRVMPGRVADPLSRIALMR